jgi:hypothetical protein
MFYVSRLFSFPLLAKEGLGEVEVTYILFYSQINLQPDFVSGSKQSIKKEY